MVTESEYTGNDKYLGAVTLYGLSTDTKPVSVGNGSCFVEMDTGTISFFDAESSDWIEFDSTGVALPSVSSSDNGDVLTVVNGAWDKAAPSGGGVLVVRFDEDTGAADKTWQEICDALANGQVAIDLYVDSLGVTQGLIVAALHQGGKYEIYEGDINTKVAEASSADGFPVYTD